MEVPPHKLFQDFLMLVLFIVWAFKIGFHFNYLKAVDSSIKERSFVTFYLNTFNILRSIAVILPVFIAGLRGQEIEKAQSLRRSTFRSTLLFWFILTCLCYYMYMQPTEKANTSHHDLKDGAPQQRSVTIDDYCLQGPNDITRSYIDY